MECNGDMIQFSTVKEAMQDAGITLTTKDITSLLIWRDLLSPVIKYNKIRPWQIINRIPFSNILCLKVPLSIILRDGQRLFPSDIDFMPQTFILPEEFELFESEIKRIKQEAENLAEERKKLGINPNKTKSVQNSPIDIKMPKLPLGYRSMSYNSEYYEKNKDGEMEIKDEFCIKPSNGSLGKGIRIIQTGEMVDINSYCPSFFPPENKSPAVAQKYIRSHLINNTKFDLRIYALISSVEPFEIFVYRDGLARFCSAQSDCNSKFARITNVTMNKNSFFFKEPEQISRLISDVFEENFSVQQQKKIWSEIDDLIVLTLFCSHRYLLKGQQQFISNYVRKTENNYFYSKCFQIFGFDILLRENDLKPFLIEVNYRPSLNFLRNCERRMKVDMIKDALRIAVPYSPFQKLVKSREWSWSLTIWEEEINSHPELFKKSFEIKENAIEESKYSRIWPFDQCIIKENPQKHKKFIEILDKLDHLPINTQLVNI